MSVPARTVEHHIMQVVSLAIKSYQTNAKAASINGSFHLVKTRYRCDMIPLRSQRILHHHLSFTHSRKAQLTSSAGSNLYEHIKLLLTHQITTQNRLAISQCCKRCIKILKL